MTLQDAIDNAPIWAKWLSIDGYGLCATYFEVTPYLLKGLYYLPSSKGSRYRPFYIQGTTGPQLVEVNKMKNWYCKPASEAEAIEIVERAVENGAKARDLVNGMGGGVKRYHWSEYPNWGVLDGYTHTHRWDNAEQLTIRQVREQFPLPHEVKVMSKKEWQGAQNGFPPTEIDIEVRKDGRWIGATTIGKFGEWMVCALEGGGFEGFSVDDMRPLRTEREKWVEQVVSGLSGDKVTLKLIDGVAGEIYDAIKSGALKAPEVEQ